MQAHIHIVSLSCVGDLQSLLQHLQAINCFHPNSFILHILIIFITHTHTHTQPSSLPTHACHLCFSGLHRGTAITVAIYKESTNYASTRFSLDETMGLFGLLLQFLIHLLVYDFIRIKNTNWD